MGTPNLGSIGNNHIGDLSYGVTLFFALSGFLLYRPFAAALLRSEPLTRIHEVPSQPCAADPPGLLGDTPPRALVLGGVLFQRFCRSPSARPSFRPAGFWRRPRSSFRLRPSDDRHGDRACLVPRRRGRLLSGATAACPRRVCCPGTAREGSALASLCARPRRPARPRPRWQGRRRHVLPATDPRRWIANWHSVLERSFFGQADLFSFGMALAVVRVTRRMASFGCRASGARPLPSLPSLYVVSSRVSWMDAQLKLSPYNTLMGLGCALLLALVVLMPPGGSRLVRLLETRWLVVLGLLSYSVFLWHDPVIVPAGQWAHFRWPRWGFSEMWRLWCDECAALVAHLPFRRGSCAAAQVSWSARYQRQRRRCRRRRRCRPIRTTQPSRR